MRKILSSLACACAICTFANAGMFELDMQVSNIKQPENSTTKYDDDSTGRLNLKIQSFKNSYEDSPMVGSFRIGTKFFETDILNSGKKVAEISENLFDFDLMLGYGWYIDEGSAITKVNLLAGLYHVNYAADYTSPGIFTITTNTIVKSNAFKFGISTLTDMKNGFIGGLNIFARTYLDDKRSILLKAGETDSNTKIEAEGMLGYKFSKSDKGFMIGLKAGYHNDLIGKGGHFGLSLGYIF